MKTDIKKNVLKYYETGYKKKGANYQRKYPNEEFTLNTSSFGPQDKARTSRPAWNCM